MAESATRISASVKIRGRNFNASDIQIQSFVNGGTTYSLSGYYDEEAKARSASADMSLGDIVKEGVDSQNYILKTARTEPDISIQLSQTGNDAASATFSGFLSAPGIAVTDSHFSRTFQGVGVESILSMFVGAVYGPVVLNGAAVLREGDSSKDQGAMNFESTSFAQSLLNAIDWCMTSFEIYRGVFTSEMDELLAGPTHDRNKAIYPLVAAALKASATTTSYPEFKNAFTYDQEKIQNALLKCIISQPNLMQGINGAFTSAFPCYFVPALTTDKFRLKLIDFVHSDPKERSLSPTNLSIVAGGTYALPLKGVVVVTALPASPGKEGLADRALFEKIAAIYPLPEGAETLAGGTFQKVGVPLWFPDVTSGAYCPALKNLQKLIDEKPKASTIPSRKKTYVDALKKANDSTLDLVKRYAESQYLYLSLASSQATLTLPLVLNIEPGETWKITSRAGKGETATALFQGFVQSVAHRINTSGNNTAEASTTLMFSHVKLNGFDIAGKDKLSEIYNIGSVSNIGGVTDIGGV